MGKAFSTALELTIVTCLLFVVDCPLPTDP